MIINSATSSHVHVEEIVESFDQKKETCHKEFRKSLLGVKECFVNVAPARYIYDVELLRIALSMLMRDVLPLIKALGMKPSEVTKYTCQSPEPEKGSFGLLQYLWKETPKSDTHRRHDFCDALGRNGYVGVARSVYLDYEPSLNELYILLSDLFDAERQQIFKHLELDKDAIGACIGANGQVNVVEAIRLWRNRIRPVPYHYRLEIATCLEAVRRQDLAEKVLAGYYRTKEADKNVLGNICGRLNDDQIKGLYKLLDLKRGKEDREQSTTVMTNWVSQWIKDFDPSSKTATIPGTLDKLKHRKDINNKIFSLGCHELAEEIMRLERGVLSE